jgi:hypothetical protein
MKHVNPWRTLALALFAASIITTAQAQGLRAEVGRPLQQAGELLKQGKAREALAKVREAEAVGGKTANEQLTIDRMKAAAAQRAGDSNTAIQALEGIYARVGGNEKGQIAEQLASVYAQQRNNAKAGEWVNNAIQAGNNGSGIRQMQSYLQSVSGDYSAIARDAAAAVSAAEQAGRRPAEGDLLRLADAQQRMNNLTAYGATLGKLLQNYPKKDYWAAYLARLPRKPGFSPRYELDVLRLRLASGTLESTSDYMEMAQLALQARLPAEGLRITEEGFKAGALGTGPEAGRHQRLRDLAVKREAEAKAAMAQKLAEARAAATGDDLVEVGYAVVTMGQVEEGIGLIKAGIAKGKLQRPDEAQLRLGMAQRQSAKSKAAANATLRGVKGSDGAADIARMWTVLGHS